MTINNEYENGQIVYLKTDIDQKKRIVTAIKVAVSGAIIYFLCCDTEETEHFAVEISDTKDLLMGMTNE